MDYIYYVIWLIMAGCIILCLIYFFIQEKFIFVPTFTVDRFQNNLSTPVESYHINTPNKGIIHGLLLKVPHAKGVIYYLHGNTGSLKRWQFKAEELSGYGYDVFAIDYRGYGESQGKRNEAFLHRDVEFCFDWLKERYPDSPIIVYGRSLGTGFATRVAARRHPSKLVLETPYFNLIDVAQFYVPFLPVKWLLRYRMRSDIQLQLVDCPTIIFHGTKDIIVPHSSALKLFRIAQHKSNVQMITIVGGRHGNLNSFPLFREKLRLFLQ